MSEHETFSTLVGELLVDLGVRDIAHDFAIGETSICFHGYVDTLGQPIEVFVECVEGSQSSGVLAAVQKLQSLPQYATPASLLFIVSAAPMSDADSISCQVAGLRVLTLEALERYLAYGIDHARQILEEYESRPLFSAGLYQSLPISVLAAADEALPRGDFDAFVTAWLDADTGPPVMFLVGDYGDGKTTSLERACWRTAERLLAGATRRVPLLFRLKDFGLNRDLSEFIHFRVVQHFGIVVRDYRTFLKANERGRLLMVFDGLDEIDAAHTHRNIVRELKQFGALVAPRARVIISCRNTYFSSDAQLLSSLQNAGLMSGSEGAPVVFRLSAFSTDGVIDFATKHPRMNADKVAALTGNTRLVELMRKPIIAELVCHGLGIQELSTARVTGEVYSYFIKGWLARDDWRSVLTTEQKFEYCSRLAKYLRLEGRSTVPAAVIEQLLGRWLPIDLRQNVQRCLVDFLNASLLTRSPAGEYGLFHRSVMEFLWARTIVQTLQGVATRSSSQPIHEDLDACLHITVETVHFVEDILEHDSLLPSRIIGAKEAHWKNLATLLLWSNDVQRPLVDALRSERDGRLATLRKYLS